MGYPLRWFIPDVMYEVTTRTIQERYLLAPSPGAKDLVLGVLGRGLALYPAVRLHAFAYLSNHCHLLVSSSDGHAFALFLGYVNSNVAREMGRLHDWRGPFWGSRGRPIPILDESAAIERLRYVMSQGVKEGLVADPIDWPGATSIAGLIGSMQLEGLWVDRDLETRARRSVRPIPRTAYETPFTIQLEPIPPWRHLSHDEFVRRHRLMLSEIVTRYRERNDPARGPHAATVQDPHARPESPDRRPAPLCHASTRAVRDAFKAAYRSFAAAFRRAASLTRDAFTKGLNIAAALAHFPPGSYPRPQWHQPLASSASRPGPVPIAPARFRPLVGRLEQ